MAYVNFGPNKSTEFKQAWSSCSYCGNTDFKHLPEFINHLRNRHCTREGGSFVCRYGDNGVCNSLPVEGVSDADYEHHVYKHHAYPLGGKLDSRQRKTSTSSTTKTDKDAEKWTLNTTAQNLPAVLNDPNLGKQKDFFTKTWGDSFVEVTDIPGPHYLPRITLKHFQKYLQQHGKELKIHSRINAAKQKPHSHTELKQHFPSLRLSSKPNESNQFDFNIIPKIFLESNFDLNDLETFNAVFPHLESSKDTQDSTKSIPDYKSRSRSAKLLEEKLTHYLDIVEVKIAQQVAQKSDAFFHVMTSHDTVMDQLGQTITIVKHLRGKIKSIDCSLVRDSLLILKHQKLRSHYVQVHEKLKLMSTVLQTQPTIQLLLSTPDYVAALDLIYTTQELLSKELAGIHSFRHLGSELNEMMKVIGSLMTGEFERYATADLNRPLLESEDQVLEGDKLQCIVLGMLRRGCYDFVDAYQQETVSAIKAAIKQTVIEVVAMSELANQRIPGDASLEDQLKALAVEEWTLLLKNSTTALRRLIRRVKKAHDVMQQATDASAGKSTAQTELRNEEGASSDMPILDSFLSEEDHAKVTLKLKQLLSSACQYTQERCAQLLCSKSLTWPEDKYISIDKDGNSKISSHWLAERATLTQLSELSQHVESLSQECEAICPDASAFYLRSAFKSQANKFMQRFHYERITKLSLILDSESWRQAEVPVEFQQLLNQISESGEFSVSREETDRITQERGSKPADFLYVDGEKFAVAGTVLILINIAAEYCVRAEDMTLSAQSLLHYLSELLALFNARAWKLVLGAEAVSEKTGLKKITSTNLVLVLRALQLLLWLIPHIRIHFQGLLPEGSRMSSLDSVTQQVKTHVRDVQAKLLSIMEPLVVNELKQWEAKPPVPSRSFQNICKHLRKLHEAIAGIMPEDQIEDLYKHINTAFKTALRGELMRLNIVNNGGPLHGLVTSELIFYLEDLKRIRALPEEELCLEAMNDLWTLKTSLAVR